MRPSIYAHRLGRKCARCSHCSAAVAAAGQLESSARLSGRCAWALTFWLRVDWLLRNDALRCATRLAPLRGSPPSQARCTELLLAPPPLTLTHPVPSKLLSEPGTASSSTPSRPAHPGARSTHARPVYPLVNCPCVSVLTQLPRCCCSALSGAQEVGNSADEPVDEQARVGEGAREKG